MNEFGPNRCWNTHISLDSLEKNARAVVYLFHCSLRFLWGKFLMALLERHGIGSYAMYTLSHKHIFPLIDTSVLLNFKNSGEFYDL